MLVSMRSANVASAAMNRDAGCAGGSCTDCPRMSMPASYNACARVEGDAKKRTVTSTRVSAALICRKVRTSPSYRSLSCWPCSRYASGLPPGGEFPSSVSPTAAASRCCRRLLRHSHKPTANAVRAATPPVMASVKIQRRYMYRGGGRPATIAMQARDVCGMSSFTCILHSGYNRRAQRGEIKCTRRSRKRRSFGPECSSTKAQPNLQCRQRWQQLMDRWSRRRCCRFLRHLSNQRRSSSPDQLDESEQQECTPNMTLQAE